MKIKLTKEQLDKMILESLENKINSDIEEDFDNTQSDIEYDLPNHPQTRGTITADELLTPGRFYKDTDM
jgi:hypothetical protein